MDKDLVRIPLKTEAEFEPKHINRNICIGWCIIFIILAFIAMIFIG